MADTAPEIKFTDEESFQATCAWKTLVFVKLVMDTLSVSMDDASSEISLLQGRIKFLEEKIDGIQKEYDILDTEMNEQQRLMSSVANNAFSRLGTEVAPDDFDLAFKDDEVKGRVVGLARVLTEE